MSAASVAGAHTTGLFNRDSCTCIESRGGSLYVGRLHGCNEGRRLMAIHGSMDWGHCRSFHTGNFVSGKSERDEALESFMTLCILLLHQNLSKPQTKDGPPSLLLCHIFYIVTRLQVQVATGLHIWFFLEHISCSN